ncbi:2,3-bisphosphoglycerate-independent phosphoglycerate mutase [Selenomonas ruminantium]|uniref:2,3-bisphosphoglycerate-independent phosphoglycerate mutase n=1 Tax=Selenomonas ruminantium TaxID=971 RepID=UPI000479C866|nr:2,3-bisphosphoglycerate-independent phosphoglycerate mutase [Selenomonas ruminantium]
MATLKNAPVALIIMDGCGLGDKTDKNNAVQVANTPVLDGLLAKYKTSQLQASGEFVGLPDGQMGNSEVGHTNIGAGRIIYQQLTRITRDIKNGDFFKNEALLSIVNGVKEKNGALHLMGLVSPGGVHSHQDHLYALLEMAKKEGIKEVYVHAFLDGRDVPPQSAQPFLEELEAKCKEIGAGCIATVSGRYYAMDRDNRWERVVKAYEAITHAEGVSADSAVAGLKASYDNDVNDEFVVPFVVKGYEGMKNGDGAIFFNFRPDRARQLTHSFVDEIFDGFERDEDLKIPFATFSQYEDGMNALVAFPPESINNTLGEIIQNKGMTQLRIAETEKYAHVTFFFNGGVEEPYKGEDRILVPSPKVATYDLQPEMSAVEVTDKVVEAIKSGKYDFIILNYANCDMVGHTGVFPAVIKAVETVDTCVGRFVDAIREVGGEVCITADHGNADKMMDYDNDQPFTKHTTNPVPFIVVSDRVKSVKDGALCDIAPTLLTLAGVEIPAEMTGKNLVEL